METSPAELCNTKDGQLTGLFRPFIDNLPRTDTSSAYGSVRGEIHGVCNVHVYCSTNLSFYIVCNITHIISKVVTRLENNKNVIFMEIEKTPDTV